MKEKYKSQKVKKRRDKIHLKIDRRGLRIQKKDYLYFILYFNYIAVLKHPDNCKLCKTCINKCPFNAIELNNNEAIEINIDRCMGCGVCVVNCPSNAIELERFEREEIYKDQIQLGLKVSKDRNKKIKL